MRPYTMFVRLKGGTIMPDKLMPRGRRSIRLAEYDYAEDGVYFVTICVQKRECLLGEVVGGEIVLSTLGCIVLEEWERTAVIRREIQLDEFVIMPNHLHAIIIITADIVGAHGCAPLQQHTRPVNDASRYRAPRSLGALIAGFKSASTKRVNQVRETPGLALWQRNYYEHIVRDENSLNVIRQYIQVNPAQWAFDDENPEKIG